MPTPISQPTPQPNKAVIAAKLTPATHGVVIQNIRETPVRQRAIIERGGLGDDGHTAWARKGEARRDRRADRVIPTAASDTAPEAGNILCITGQSPSGRKFRIRFVPKHADSAPIARRA